MRQVLFTIPIFGGVKVFGYGAMLVLAFISSTWLAYWRARRERLDPEVIGDMSFWVFLFGLIGARLFYCIEYWGEDIKTCGTSSSTGRGASSITEGSSAGWPRFSFTGGSGRFPCVLTWMYWLRRSPWERSLAGWVVS